ncbi:transketolase [Methanoplanus limicola]|uniref:Transketolase domain-containing protein n=1 Tax=Methanoplanus limicola DSM 2279 TaxID=937775 RepID=H1YXC1_9EURY|nr:transketolase [Methanoplanus limicola]EHQ36858.1 Transketolase domain-containing protein [Methanoplanus limicola DSM 2279]
MVENNIKFLNNTSKSIRKKVIEMTAYVGGGHYSSSLCCVDILISLYFNEMNVDPSNPSDPDRDRFILSKGHAAPGLYATLAEKGYFHSDELLTLRQLNSRLQGHPVKSYNLPGLDSSSGSLGQGISVAVGIALAGKMNNKKYRVFVLLGDGECQEGQVWEAAMSAAHYELDNLVVIIDNNKLQSTGSIDDIMSLGDISSCWKSLGWNIIEINGHNFDELLNAYKFANESKNKPTLIVANTVKGCGIPFIEDKIEYHTKPLTEEELQEGILYLEGRY